MITIDEAIDLIASLKVSPHIETRCLEEAVGGILAQDLKANINLPVFDNSAMDGYAVHLADAGKEVEVIGTVMAGQSSELEVSEGRAVKIMTGAKLPKGTEAVVPMEDVEDLGDRVRLPQKIKPQANMRFAGEDVKKGEIIAKTGQKLSAYAIGLIASQGYSYLRLYKAPKVAIFATGSELKMHYESIAGSQIYNSNTPSLLARCRELGCDTSFVGKIEDSPKAIEDAIANALDADIIITSGGVSVGEADYTKEAFKAMGMEILFSKIDIKPGKPTTLGKIGSTYVLNLPGNPLAAILNFEIFGRMLINKLSGRNDFFLRPLRAKLAEKLTLKPGRDTVIPGTFDGEHFQPLSKRAPGMVRPASVMDGFVIASKDAGALSKEVLFIPLCESVSANREELISGK